ncbi:hypothetical protein G6F65_019615 [Rhizopus arrhizus]|nr:hypothetical protein G6F65_019615 [Rhizopus arrhizus]
MADIFKEEGLIILSVGAQRHRQVSGEPVQPDLEDGGCHGNRPEHERGAARYVRYGHSRGRDQDYKGLGESRRNTEADDGYHFANCRRQAEGI